LRESVDQGIEVLRCGVVVSPDNGVDEFRSGFFALSFGTELPTSCCHRFCINLTARIRPFKTKGEVGNGFIANMSLLAEVDIALVKQVAPEAGVELKLTFAMA
jgi:hypothetical protein